jgi:protein phosphatase
MGGHQAGEVASMTAAETISKSFNYFEKDLLTDQRLALGRTLPQRAELLVKAVRLANRAVYLTSTRDPNLSGMGTTVVVVAFEADTMAVAHVGDSRAYRLKERELEPLTRDHSWIQEIQQTQNISAEEASSVVGKNIITRALGVRENVEADLSIYKVKPGEQFILCSDGLCGFADDDEIFDVATKLRGDLQKMCESLVQMANDRGGADNVTVITLQVDDTKESPLPELEAVTFPAETPELSEVEDEWLERLAETADDVSENTAETEATGGGNRWVLMLIFVLFVAVALVLIFTQLD